MKNRNTKKTYKHLANNHPEPEFMIGEEWDVKRRARPRFLTLKEWDAYLKNDPEPFTQSEEEQVKSIAKNLVEKKEEHRSKPRGYCHPGARQIGYIQIANKRIEEMNIKTMKNEPEQLDGKVHLNQRQQAYVEIVKKAQILGHTPV